MCKPSDMNKSVAAADISSEKHNMIPAVGFGTFNSFEGTKHKMIGEDENDDKP